MTNPTQVAQERDYIESVQEKPSLSLYIQETKKINSDESLNLFINGMEIVFDKNVNGFYKRYNSKHTTADVKNIRKDQICSLTICADTVIIRSKLLLPETHVTIYARKLIFEDVGEEVSCISTSPLPYNIQQGENATKSTPAKDGIAGRDAGNLSLYLQTLKTPEGLPNKPERFDLRGGTGQDAGHGLDGDNGKDIELQSKLENTDKVFEPPAYYYKYEDIYSGAAGLEAKREWGDKEAGSKRNGTDAQRPGVPGNGGNGGTFEYHIDSLNPIATNSVKALIDGGKAGEGAPSVKGGKPGKPEDICREYEVRDDIFSLSNHDDLSISSQVIEQIKMTPVGEEKKPIEGQSFPATSGSSGKLGELKLQPHHWLHAHALRVVLRYMRDIYLAGHREEALNLVTSYQKALESEPSAMADSNNLFSDAEYYAAKVEVAVLLHQLDSHLDYFGNPAGWTPLLSLQANLSAYNTQLEQAFQVLILTRWIDSLASKQLDKVGTITKAINSLDQEIESAVSQVNGTKSNIQEVEGKISTLQTQLNQLGYDLNELNKKLLKEAEGNVEQKKAIQTSCQIFAAICSVIPVGQPALGAVGSITKIISDYATAEDGDIYNTTDGIGKVLAGYTNTKLVEKADKIIKEAQKEDKTESAKQDEEAKKELKVKAEETAQQLKDIGAKLAPAIAQLNGAIKNLQVSDKEVEAELAKLQANNPKFSELVTKIKSVNSDKESLVKQITKTLQDLGKLYSHITSNHVTINTLSEEQRDISASLNPDTLLYVKNMEQRAQHTLAKYLYYVLKSYETTVFEKLKVNYQLDIILQKVNELVEKAEGKTPELHLAKELYPLLQQEMLKIQQQLLEKFKLDYTISRNFHLSKEDTPEAIDELNRESVCRINLKDDLDNQGEVVLIDPQNEMLRLSSIEITKIEIEENQTASGEQLELYIEPLEAGTIRSKEKLYAVRQPTYGESSKIWGATYNLNDGTIKKIQSNEGSLELLKFIIGDKHSFNTSNSEAVLTTPVAWTTLKISSGHAGQSTNKAKIKSIVFNCNLSFNKVSNSNLRVLDVRVRFKGAESLPITCTPPDLNGRSNGVGYFYRIYNKSTQVTLEAKSKYGDTTVFQHWRVTDINAGAVKQETSNPISLNLNNHMVVECIYSES